MNESYGKYLKRIPLKYGAKAELIRANYLDLPALDRCTSTGSSASMNSSYVCLDSFMPPKEPGKEPFREAWKQVLHHLQFPPGTIDPVLNDQAP